MGMPDQAIPLSITDHFPISFEWQSLPFSSIEIADQTQAAREVLNAVISLEQMAGEKPDSSLKSESPELYRLEQKVDFITELLTKVIQAQRGLPVKRKLTMNANSVQFQSDQSVQKDVYLALSVHLSSRYPLPLVLPLRVLGINSDQIEAEILFTDPEVLDDLTRLVFLIHRRQIARNRTQRV